MKIPKDKKGRWRINFRCQVVFIVFRRGQVTSFPLN